MEHQKEQCPYIFRQHSLLGMTEECPKGECGEKACNKHELDNTNKKEGPTMNMHGSVHENVPESTYGPWVVVTCRKQGTTSQGNGGPPLSMGYGQRVGKGTKARMATGLAEPSSESSRESKRKFSPQGDINGPQVASVVQRLVK